ncbi:MAG: DUF5063 domain-containing protein [Bacteroidales bacterium]
MEMENTQQQHILEFVAVSKDLVDLLESASGMNARDFVLQSRQMLPLVYLKASMLPKLENELEGELEQYVTPEHYEYVKLSLNEKLGEWDATIHLEDNILMSTEDYLHVELSELFADIYQDIGNYVSRFRDGDDAIRNDATWEVKYNFDEYWGIKVLVLTEHIHRLIVSDDFSRNSN